MFPIDILEGRDRSLAAFTAYDVVHWLPFQYLAYFPSAVFLGKITGAELAHGLLVQLVWVVFLIAMCRLLFNRGVRRYSAFGG